MAVKFIVLVAFLAVANAGMVRRDVNPLADFVKNAEDVGNTIVKAWNDVVNSPQTKQVQQTIKDNSDQVLQQLSGFSNSLNGLISEATGKTKQTLEESQRNIQRSIEELRRAHPEVEQQGNLLGQKAKEAYQNAVNESQKITKQIFDATEETNAKLAPKFQQAINDLAKGAKDFQKKIEAVANKQ